MPHMYIPCNTSVEGVVICEVCVCGGGVVWEGGRGGEVVMVPVTVGTTMVELASIVSKASIVLHSSS